MEIAKGRTRGYFTVDNAIIDGLLGLGPSGIDAVGFYCALKRFVDRRTEAESESVMDWSVEGFCKRFRIGRDRFYRLLDILWQVGLVDVQKHIDAGGWQNRYLIHDYVEYEGPIRAVRTGTFRHKKAGSGEADTGEAPGGIPETGIPETGIPETGIPEAGIPEAGIPETGRTKNTTDRKIQHQEKDNDDSLGPFSSSSNEEEEKGRAARFQGWEQLPANSSQPESPSATPEENERTGNEETFPACSGQAAPPTNRDLIAELTDRLHKIPGVEKLRGHYALIGRAYNRYGYECVRAAIEDLEAVYRGAELVGEPYPAEKELPGLLFSKCRWNAKRMSRWEDGPRGEKEKPKPRALSIEEMERLGCIVERAEDGRPVSVRIPSEEVRKRVREARGIAS